MAGLSRVLFGKSVSASMKNNFHTLNRRTFIAGAVVSAVRLAFAAKPEKSGDGYAMVARVDRARVLREAKQYLGVAPKTITAYASARNPGGVHDFFSEGDYWWPDPAHPGGPYIRRDGESNPENFAGHRDALIGLSVQMPALTAAWLLTREARYGEAAAGHLRAWFVDAATRMNANLEHAQAIHGVSPGRGTGIIDTLHLVEVARASTVLGGRFLTAAERDAVHGWFAAYLDWMQTSKNGKEEKAAKNNHGSCWALQAAEFARLVGDEKTRAETRRMYTEVLLPAQMAPNGSFPMELARTKPYSYSIFNLDVMTMLCKSLSGPGDDLVHFALPDGRGMCRGVEFLHPYLKDKSAWPYAKDVEHFESLPVRQPSLLFAGLSCGRTDFLELWKKLDPEPKDPEIVRNFPIRQPLLWVAS